MPPPAATQFSFESKELNKLNTEIEILLKWLLSAAARMAMATLTAAIKSANDSRATLSFFPMSEGNVVITVPTYSNTKQNKKSFTKISRGRGILPTFTLDNRWYGGS